MIEIEEVRKQMTRDEIRLKERADFLKLEELSIKHIVPRKRFL